jgi:hypothetical protein
MLRHKLRLLEDAVERHGSSCPALVSHPLSGLCTCLMVSLMRAPPAILTKTACSLTSPASGIASRIPTPSLAEEARALQYRCESLEAAFDQQGM